MHEIVTMARASRMLPKPVSTTVGVRSPLLARCAGTQNRPLRVSTMCPGDVIILTTSGLSSGWSSTTSTRAGVSFDCMERLLL